MADLVIRGRRVVTGEGVRPAAVHVAGGVIDRAAGRHELVDLPNKHHLPVDLTPYGLRNAGEVFVATDRPFGLIEGTVAREGAQPAAAWA